MDATAEISWNHAFVIRPEQIAKLWKLLGSQVGVPGASAECADFLRRTFSTIEELTSFENSKGREIVRLNLGARSEDYSRTARINFGGYVPISASIEGTEPMVTCLRDDLADILAGTRPWYSWIAKVDPVLLVVLVFAALFTFLNLITPDSQGPSPALSFPKAAVVVALFISLFGAIAAVAWLLKRLTDRFFPTATYAFGQGLQRHDFAEKIRWSVVISFVVGVAASSLVTLMWPAA